MSALAGYNSDKVHEQRRRAHLTSLVVALSVLAVTARLLLIYQPYIDHWSWRQSDVAAIARNFSEGGFRFAYPQIDWAGDAAGYVGTEFPILPFLAAIDTSLSILIKLTTIVIAAPITYIALSTLCEHRHTSFPRKCGAKRAPLQLWLALFAVITLLPSALWYWHAYQIAEKFYPHH